MRKNELLHFHSLLLTLVQGYDERGELPDGALAEYRDIGVTPMSIQASRDDHETAVLELSSVLAETAETTDAQAQPVGANPPGVGAE